MKKGLLSAVAAVVFAAFTSAFAGDASTYTDGDGVIWEYEYTYADNTATITRADTHGTSETGISVPAALLKGTIEMTVTGIRDGAFNGCLNIESVYLTETVAEVTGEAFRDMGSHVQVYAPDTLENKLVSGTYGKTVLEVSYFYTPQDIPLTYANFTKSQTVKGARTFIGGWTLAEYRFNGAVAELKFAKAGKSKNGQPRPVKLTATFIAPDGSKQRVKATLKVNADGSTAAPLNIHLKLNGMEEEDVTLNISGGKVSLKNDKYKFAKAKIGGVIGHSKLGFYIYHIDGAMPNFSAGWKPLYLGGYTKLDFLSFSVHIQNGRKFTTEKPARIKLKKNKDGSTTVTGADGLDNVYSLKLTYNMKTGQFRGSFKLYAVNEAKKRLKSYTVKVTGYMIQDLGYGAATLKILKAGPWPIGIWEGLG
ncbi:MAG: hypothetical protein J5985_03910 [Kiritimatiellae bacterium]|nr:hypothetical protein [Kiritimatiellia bacterium]